MSDAPLKILTVVHGYPPRAHAGAELCAHWLAKALRERGHDVSVFARTDDPALPELSLLRESFEGVPVTRLRTVPEGSTSLRATYHNERVRAVFERELAGGRFDVVHAHHTLGLSMDLLEAARRAGAKVVATIHDFWYLCPRGQRFTPWGHNCSEIDVTRCSRCIAKKRVRWGLLHLRAGLRRPLRTLAGMPGYVRENLHTRAIRRRTREIVEQLNACDRLLAGSQFVLDEHVKHGMLAQRAQRFENGIDAAWTAQLPTRDAPARPLRFGFVGSFLPSKGVDLLVAAFQSMPRDGATLSLYGTSPWDGGAFARKVEAQNHHPLVRFHGGFAHERLPSILEEIDVLVVPSRWFENAPVTLDEAALARIPVVVAAHGGMSEILARRKNGLSFRPDDSADLRVQLERFVVEPDLWQKLRDSATPVQSAANSAIEFETICRELLKPTSAPAPAAH